jgi:hypothetical protein
MLSLFSVGILTIIQKAKAKNATVISTTSPTQNSDSGEVPDRLAKRPAITHEMEVQDLATRADASRQAVLQTNELLKGILAFLPPKQLFVDQRVCKQWRNVVASSPELQKKMFLRVDETPRQKWGLKVDYSPVDLSMSSELRRFDNSPPSPPWQQVTPVILSPHLIIEDEDDIKLPGMGARDYVVFQLPCSLLVGSHTSILDTYISSPPCYEFEFYLEFKFEPAIPSYGCLSMNGVRFQTGRALKVGEVFDRARAIRTDAVLRRIHLDEPAKTKKYRNVTANEVIKELQQEYTCTATLCPSSALMLNNVMVPNEQQRAEVKAAHAKTIQRME